jgi:hypothetical protein
MRAPLSLPLLIAALLAASGCASTPPAPTASPPRSNPSSALQNCTPQSFPGTSSSATPATAGARAIPAAPQPTSVPVPTQTAAQRRALIDKRLTDLRRSLNAPGNRSPGGTDPSNGDGYRSLNPANLRLPDPRPPATAKPGNGATAREMPTRSGDDLVARRLRKAAEQETDPGLKQKLWREYVDYRQNAQGK